MNNYNDFPTLSNEQYKELNDMYFKSNNKEDIISNLGTKLQFCIDSFMVIKKDFNTKTQEEISHTISNLSSVKESLKILYSNINYKNNKISTNIFTVVSEMLNLTIYLSQQITITEKLYYKKVLYKTNIIVLKALSSFMLTLSKQNIKFFKYM